MKIKLLFLEAVMIISLDGFSQSNENSNGANNEQNTIQIHDKYMIKLAAESEEDAKMFEAAEKSQTIFHSSAMAVDYKLNPLPLEDASNESSAIPETEYQKQGKGKPGTDELQEEGNMIRLPD